MKIRARELTDGQRIETLDALYTASGTVRGRDAMKLFLRDLLTESERIMLGRRILIARRLLGGAKFDEISAEMKVGHDTIAKVQRWLGDKLPGYEQAITGLEQEFKKREMRRESQQKYESSLLFRLKKNIQDISSYFLKRNSIVYYDIS